MQDSEVFQRFLHFVETPTHVVCAVLVGESSDHYDLAVVSCPTNGYRAVFTMQEWPSCRAKILAYLKQGPVQISRWQTPPNAGGRQLFYFKNNFLFSSVTNIALQIMKRICEIQATVETLRASAAILDSNISTLINDAENGKKSQSE